MFDALNEEVYFPEETMELNFLPECRECHEFEIDIATVNTVKNGDDVTVYDVSCTHIGACKYISRRNKSWENR